MGDFCGSSKINDKNKHSKMPDIIYDQYHQSAVIKALNFTYHKFHYWKRVYNFKYSLSNKLTVSEIMVFLLIRMLHQKNRKTFQLTRLQNFSWSNVYAKIFEILINSNYNIIFLFDILQVKVHYEEADSVNSLELRKKDHIVSVPFIKIFEEYKKIEPIIQSNVSDSTFQSLSLPKETQLKFKVEYKQYVPHCEIVEPNVKSEINWSDYMSKRSSIILQYHLQFKSINDLYLFIEKKGRAGLLNVQNCGVNSVNEILDFLEKHIRVNNKRHFLFSEFTKIESHLINIKNAINLGGEEYRSLINHEFNEIFQIISIPNVNFHQYVKERWIYYSKRKGMSVKRFIDFLQESRLRCYILSGN